MRLTFLYYPRQLLTSNRNRSGGQFKLPGTTQGWNPLAKLWWRNHKNSSKWNIWKVQKLVIGKIHRLVKIWAILSTNQGKKSLEDFATFLEVKMRTPLAIRSGWARTNWRSRMQNKWTMTPPTPCKMVAGSVVVSPASVLDPKWSPQPSTAMPMKFRRDFCELDMFGPWSYPAPP